VTESGFVILSMEKENKRDHGKHKSFNHSIQCDSLNHSKRLSYKVPSQYLKANPGVLL